MAGSRESCDAHAESTTHATNAIGRRHPDNDRQPFKRSLSICIGETDDESDRTTLPRVAALATTEFEIPPRQPPRIVLSFASRGSRDRIEADMLSDPRVDQTSGCGHSGSHDGSRTAASRRERSAKRQDRTTSSTSGGAARELEEAQGSGPSSTRGEPQGRRYPEPKCCGRRRRALPRPVRCVRIALPLISSCRRTASTRRLFGPG